MHTNITIVDCIVADVIMMNLGRLPPPSDTMDVSPPNRTISREPIIMSKTYIY